MTSPTDSFSNYTPAFVKWASALSLVLSPLVVTVRHDNLHSHPHGFLVQIIAVEGHNLQLRAKFGRDREVDVPISQDDFRIQIRSSLDYDRSLIFTDFIDHLSSKCDESAIGNLFRSQRSLVERTPRDELSGTEETELALTAIYFTRRSR